jgi:tetratricopeptide (TPR) repeat protein
LKELIYCTFFIVYLFAGISCTQNDEEKLFVEAKLKFSEEKYKDAEVILYNLIENTTDTVKMHDYYTVLYSVLRSEGNLLARKNKIEEPKKTDVPESRKGTVALIWGMGKEDSSVLAINKKKIELAEQYIQQYPNGKHRNDFLSALLFLYRKEDVIKEIYVAEKLLNSKYYQDKFYSRLFFSTIYHEKKDYKKAIKYYDEIIDMQEDSVKKAVYYLYKADCYYNLGDISEAINNLERIYILEQDDTNKYMSYYADKWMPYYRDFISNPYKKRKQFVYFED